MGALVLGQLVTLALGLAIMYSFTLRTVTADARTATEVARNTFANIYRDQGLRAMVETVASRLDSHEDPNFVAFLRRPDGRRVLGNIRHWPEGIVGQEGWREKELWREGAKTPESIGFVVLPLPDGYTLLTGQVLDAHVRLARASTGAFALAMLTGIVLAALVAGAIGRIVERRIDDFSKASAAIAHGRLETRVARNRTGDAFDRLANSTNAMLERIEVLVGELRMITDSMAHDLRSPVARMKAMLEQAAARTQDPAAREAVADALDEADSLHRLLDTALEISRAEAGIGRDRFVEISLPELFEDLAEVYGPLAEEEGFTITVDVQDIRILAHRELLMRAISNLIDNALKYAHGGTHIALRATRTGAWRASLSVSDNGPGIPPELRQEARRRFGRLDPARTQSGAGLGLALAETIAHLHRGSLELLPVAPQGLCIQLTLPLDGGLAVRAEDVG